MKKNKPDAMIIDDFGNIYYSAASLNELKQKYKEELTLEKNAYNRMYNMYVEHYEREKICFRDFKDKIKELKGSDKE